MIMGDVMGKEKHRYQTKRNQNQIEINQLLHETRNRKSTQLENIPIRY